MGEFYSTYLAVYHLLSLAQKDPEILDSDAIQTLRRLLEDPRWSHQRQGLFLCRLAAETLAAVVLKGRGRPAAEAALGSLREVLTTASGFAHRATAETIGSFPLGIKGPSLPETDSAGTPALGWRRILEQSGFRIRGTPKFFGRSLVSESEAGDRLLVLKFARSDQDLSSLCREPQWMRYLREQPVRYPHRFDIPEPVEVEGARMFRLPRMPVNVPETLGLHPNRYTIGFIAHRDYYTYPNHDSDGRKIGPAKFKGILGGNAWLMGRLSAWGIVHTAPIPLFHNRVQADRRRDLGVYEWFRAGRLDRWLASCSFPNLGPTGLRDFEHLAVFTGSSRDLYRYIGRHLLSMLLIAGSFFRNKAPDRVGLDADGRPVDARDLFDAGLFKELISEIFINYYEGFAGEPLLEPPPVDLDRLTARMIDEMGVDRHMEEIFRTADQAAMGPEAFRDFLAARGFTDARIRQFRQGAEDIVICSGPHLGEFNRPISLPEMIEAVGGMAALCMAGRFFTQTLRPKSPLAPFSKGGNGG